MFAPELHLSFNLKKIANVFVIRCVQPPDLSEGDFSLRWLCLSASRRTVSGTYFNGTTSGQQIPVQCVQDK